MEVQSRRRESRTHLSEIPKDDVSVGVKDGEGEEEEEVRCEVIGEKVLRRHKE